MKTNTHECRIPEAVATFLRILRERRSRRFGLGMKMASGPMAFQSRHAGIPLSEEEEALLVFAACGVTGYALADLMYGQGQGGTIMSRLLGRTIPSGDGAQTVALIVMNRDPVVPYPLGIEKNGLPLLNAMCPPYYPSMEGAVRTVVDAKVGPQGIFRGGAVHSVWRDPTSVVKASLRTERGNDPGRHCLLRIRL